MSTMTRNDIHFDAESHTYTIHGVEYPGITKRIGKRLGKVFPSCLAEVPRVGEAAEFGSLVHADMERFIKKGKKPRHPTTQFIVDEFLSICPQVNFTWASELLVSDYKSVCTAIDLVGLSESEGSIIFDIKTGNFDREYCSWQLGIGKYLLEQDGDVWVKECYVISTKDKWTYEIIPKSKERVMSLLYG